MKTKAALLVILLSLLAGTIVSASPKMLMFHPTRLIFTDRQRAIAVNVINRYDEPITYSIAVVNLEKGEDGEFHEIDGDEKEMVSSMIRFSPRRATITPHERQVIKLMVRKPKSLPAGEYRTYLKLQPHPTQSTQQPVVSEAKGTQQIALEVLVSSFLPIIIQHEIPIGEVTPQAIQLRQNSDTDSEPAVEVTLSRRGEGSAFGDLTLEFIPPDKPKEMVTLGKVQGMAFYAPDTSKKQTVLISKDIPCEQLKQGKIKISWFPRTRVQDRRGKQQYGQENSIILEP